MNKQKFSIKSSNKIIYLTVTIWTIFFINLTLLIQLTIFHYIFFILMLFLLITGLVIGIFVNKSIKTKKYHLYLAGFIISLISVAIYTIFLIFILINMPLQFKILIILDYSFNFILPIILYVNKNIFEKKSQTLL